MARKQVALAKISRPRLHDVLARTRLYGTLDAACARPVVWLCAGPTWEPISSRGRSNAVHR